MCQVPSYPSSNRENTLTNLSILPKAEQRICAGVQKSESFCPAVVVISLDVLLENLVIKAHPQDGKVEQQVNSNDKQDIPC